MHRGWTGYFDTLSPRDAAFVYDEGPSNHEMLVACYVFDAADGSPSCATEARLHEWMRRRLGAADFLTRRIRRAPFDIGLPCWIPATPDLAEHVSLHHVAGGHTGLTGTIAELASRPLDLSRPPWELHALAGASGAEVGLEGAGDVTVIMLKVHHCAADGMALRASEPALFTDHPVAAGPAADPPHHIETSMRALLTAPWRTLRFVRGVQRTRKDVDDVAARVSDGRLRAPARDRPVTRFDIPLSGALAVEVAALNLADIREARSAAAGATVNDVLLAAVGGAMRRTLIEAGESLNGGLAALVPISLRLADSSSGVPRVEAGGGASANQLVLGTVDLHVDIADPVERLVAVAETSRAEKARWMDPRLRSANARMDTAPSWLLKLRGTAQRAGKRAVGRTVLRNTMVSNLPSPPGDPRLDGAPLIAAFGVLPVVDGGRLRHLFTACGDRIFLSVSSDHDAIPNPADYSSAVSSEVDSLLVQPD